MSDTEFRFDMTLNDGAITGHILVDVFRSVLGHVGLKGEAADRLVDQVMKERRAAPAGACTIHFAARAGEFEITLTQSGRNFRTTCPVPVR